MRIAKLKGTILDCTKKVFSVLLLNEKNYHKFKYSTSVQISSDMKNVIKDVSKKSKEFDVLNNSKKVSTSLMQKTLR